jgi:signal transduction histidine kinase
LPARDERGRPRSIVALGRDVTEPRAAQEEIESVRRCLAGIGESASILAHEIKNPITALHVALRAVASEIGEDPAEVLQDFQRRLHRMERLLRRTLEYTRPMRPRLRRTSVQELVDPPLRRLAAAFEERGALCDFVAPEGTPTVMADEALVGEALTSLLENSLDALASGGHVRITSRVEGPTLVLCVEDDGPGLTEAARESLFQPFHTTRREGAGLGLALGRRIAEAHGGALEPGEGTLGGACFQLKLPLAKRSDAEPSP